jgi:hypothetical protein
MLGKLLDLSYEQFVEELEELIKDPKIHSLISAGKEDGAPNDEKILFSKGTVLCSTLVPMQKELFIEKSVRWAIINPENTKTMLKGKPLSINNIPIVTLNSKYIIDGHHRWVECYTLNPNSKVVIYNIERNDDPIQILKIIQMAIAADTKQIPKSPSDGTNIYKMSDTEISQYIKSNISKDVEFLVDNAVALFTDNVMQLKQNNKPYGKAPDRAYMPQTSKSKNYDSKLKNGEVNYLAPFDRIHKRFTEFIK